MDKGKDPSFCVGGGGGKGGTISNAPVGGPGAGTTTTGGHSLGDMLNASGVGTGLNTAGTLHPHIPGLNAIANTLVRDAVGALTGSLGLAVALNPPAGAPAPAASDTDHNCPAARASAIARVNTELSGHTFYRVNGFRFSRMRPITVEEALLRAWTGGNIYTRNEGIAHTFAAIAGIGPPLARSSDVEIVYNRHFHLRWQQGTGLNAHILFGAIKDAGGRWVIEV